MISEKDMNMSTEIKEVNSITSSGHFVAKADKEEMLNRVEELIVSGFTNQTAMAKSMNVSQPTISRMIKKIELRLAERHRRSTKAKRATRISQLEHILNLAVESYKKSLKDDVETTTHTQGCMACGTLGKIDKDGEMITCPSCFGKGVLENKTVKRKIKSGDSSMLRVATDCIKECARIQGVYIDAGKSKGTLRQLTLNQKKISDTEIESKIEELYIDAPVDLLINAKRLITELQETKEKTTERKVIESVKITDTKIPG